MASTSRTRSWRAHRKLLIVDDEQRICRLLEEFFSLKGYEVRSVCRGEDALPVMMTFQPQVVLLDLLMPGIGGIATLKQLKLVDPARKVLILTSTDYDDAVHSTELSADGYVCKPPNLEQLELLVEGLCRNSASGSNGHTNAYCTAHEQNGSKRGRERGAYRKGEEEQAAGSTGQRVNESHRSGHPLPTDHIPPAAHPAS